jgi:DNA modification methylase
VSKSKTRSGIVSIALSASEQEDLAACSLAAGCDSIATYLLGLHAAAKAKAVGATKSNTPASVASVGARCRKVFSTDLGIAILGNSADYMARDLEPQSVDLIMTSPPFGLLRKKQYGNEAASEYCNWFRPFAEGCRRVLKDSGSLVIDIGGAWNPGIPTRSLYHFDLLLMLCREFGFHLCLEHFWWNPAKLPTPAEWVNVRRVRVKDAVNCVWWLSPSPWPKASNRRVLAAYSDSMQTLLRNGYSRNLRPSGHDISPHFQRDNGGSVPPNLLAIANTESNSRYQAYCREHGLPIHPARFPSLLPEYFIRMLTDEGDVVVDPFAGSCVTGAVAESLGRRWIGIDLCPEYLDGARGRLFGPATSSNPSSRPTRYEIAAPCGVVSSPEGPLAADGGRARPGGGRRKPIK